MNKLVMVISTILLIIVGLLIYTSYNQHTLPVNVVTPPQVAPKPVELSGWIPWWTQNSSLNKFNQYGENINRIYLTWVYLNDDGLEYKYESANKFIIDRQKENGVQTYLTVSNVLGSDYYGKLPKEEKLQAIVDDIINFTNKYGFDGINLDLEYITKDEEVNYKNFIDAVVSKSKEHDLGVSVAIPSISGDRHTWKGAEGVDIEYICNKVDNIIVMMYDLHNAKTSFGPLSTYSWLDEVVNYNLKRCSVDKIVAGLPLYGYAWNSNGKFIETVNEDVLNQKYSQLSTTRDDSSSELIGVNSNFTLFISDTESVSSKMDFLRDYGIYKFAIWHLGNLNDVVAFN